MAEHFGKHLERQRIEQIASVSNAECNSAQLLAKCKSKQRTKVHRLYVLIPSVNPDWQVCEKTTGSTSLFCSNAGIHWEFIGVFCVCLLVCRASEKCALYKWNLVQSSTVDHERDNWFLVKHKTSGCIFVAIVLASHISLNCLIIDLLLSSKFYLGWTFHHVFILFSFSMIPIPYLSPSSPSLCVSPLIALAWSLQRLIHCGGFSPVVSRTRMTDRKSTNRKRGKS